MDRSDGQDHDRNPQDSRRFVDHGNEFVRWKIDNARNKRFLLGRIKPQATFLGEVPPPMAWKTQPHTSLCSKFVHMSLNRTRQAVITAAWTPDGRRLLAGAMSGEFTLWNGMNFNFEMLMQAHEEAVRSTRYSYSGEWLLSGDQGGVVKVWQPNFNMVNLTQAHRESVRAIAWAPGDAKFATCSDDGLVKVWSFATMQEEVSLSGHGWDVKSVDWHPELSLLVSGSKDNMLKLWDPRQGKALATLHGFKNTINRVAFQPGGGQRLFAAAGKDSTTRIFDLRTMEQALVLRGHETEITALTWHPMHSQLLSVGSHAGEISHYLLDSHVPEDSAGLMPVLSIPKAHQWPVWDLAYHPVGHMLCSASNDRSVRFWARGRPGDPIAYNDRYYLDTGNAEDSGLSELEKFRQRERERERLAAASTVIPGLSLPQ